MNRKLENVIPNPFPVSSNGSPSQVLEKKPKSMRTLHAEAIRRKIAEHTANKIQPILDAMTKAALGEVVTWKDTKEGRYEEKRGPDVNAARLLIEQAAGRPKESIDISGKVGIVALIAQLEGNDIR